MSIHEYKTSNPKTPAEARQELIDNKEVIMARIKEIEELDDDALVDFDEIVKAREKYTRKHNEH